MKANGPRFEEIMTSFTLRKGTEDLTLPSQFVKMRSFAISS